MSDATHAYVAVKSCGCVVAAHVDKPEYAKDIAKALARWVKDGLTVERRDIQHTRATVKACNCARPAVERKASSQLDLLAEPS